MIQETSGSTRRAHPRPRNLNKMHHGTADMAALEGRVIGTDPHGKKLRLGALAKNRSGYVSHRRALVAAHDRPGASAIVKAGGKYWTYAVHGGAIDFNPARLSASLAGITPTKSIELQTATRRYAPVSHHRYRDIGPAVPPKPPAHHDTSYGGPGYESICEGGGLAEALVAFGTLGFGCLIPK